MRHKKPTRTRRANRKTHRFESLEPRMVLTGTADLFDLGAEGEGVDSTSTLTVFANSQQVTIPENIGVRGDGTMAAVFSETDGQLRSMSAASSTLGDFFDIWRTDAGIATNNSGAVLSANQLLTDVADADRTVQMFVNGQVSSQFENYSLQDGDDIVLVYGANPVVSLVTNFGGIVLELFQQVTPGTVANFLNYLNDGDYLNSFFHRSANNFVIQGGGFVTPSTTFSSVGQFTNVPTDPQIQNEPGISNVRGTVAMAKTSDPNSATSQFFVNLNDNNTFLDLESNGAFTVFAQVLGMTTSDTIAALPVDDTNASPYSELPVSAAGELAVIQSVAGLGDVTGVKFLDDNGNGVQDGGENGIANVIVFADANGNGVFDTEEASTTTDNDGRYLLQLAPGTHTLRAQVTAGSITSEPSPLNSHSVTVEIGREVSDVNFGETTLLAPTAVDLLAGSDSGTANDDNITNRNNATALSALSFIVSGVRTGAEVRLFDGGVLIGSAMSSGTSTVVATDGSTLIQDGTRTLTSTQVLDGVESAISTSLVVTVDTVAPGAIASDPPDIAQVGQSYSFDADSPDEISGGISYSLADAPTGMTIDSTTGVISWTPSSDQAVPQLFEIRVSDDAGNQVSTVADVTVLGVIPAFPDEYTAVEDTTLTIAVADGILDNDGDQNSGMLTAVVDVGPDHGVLTLDDDGSFTYVPDDDFSGDDSFTYSATNGTDDSNIARVTIHVTNVNDAPQPLADEYSTQEDVPLVLDAVSGVLANDQDLDDDVLTATIDTGPSHGSLDLASDGSFTYTPDADYHGSDSFTYTTTDGTETSAPVTVTLTISEVLDPPMGVADSYSLNEDSTLTIDASTGVLTNDTDVDSSALTAALATQAGHGIVTLDSDGSFVYVPDADFFGTDSFTYNTLDGVSTSSATTVTMTVAATADSPSAIDDSVDATSDGTTATFDVLANDTSDPDGVQSLVITAVTQGSQGGAVSFTGGSITYTAAIDFVGAETFTYTIQDSDGLTDSATVTVTVTPGANNTLSGVVYVDLNGDGIQNTGEVGIPGVQIFLTGTALGGASVNRSVLTFSNGVYQFEELPAGTYELTERQPAALLDGLDTTLSPNATAGNDLITNLTIGGGETLSQNFFGETSLDVNYVSIAWFFASAAPVELMFRATIARAEELDGNQQLATSIREGAMDDLPDLVEPTNGTPIANNDVYSGGQDAVIVEDAAGGVLANDTDSDGDPLTAVLVQQPTNGVLVMNADGSFTYSPSAGFSGTDTFTYQAGDGTAFSATASVQITITASDPPSNEFNIVENSGPGTVVGQIEVAGESDDTIFELDDANRPTELFLAADDHITGDPTASVVLVEYLDLQCPACQSYHPLVAQLEQDFAGDLLVVRRHLPLTNVHLNAMAAAIASEAAARQDAFEPMADLMFEHQDDWEFAADPQPFFESYANELGLDLTQFVNDQSDATLIDRVNRDANAAAALGATSTPSFFLNGQAISNPASVEDFSALVQAELDAENATFGINRFTGHLFVADNSALDFETNESFTVTVRTASLDGTRDSVDATIHVTNVNDVAPIATSDQYDVAVNGILVADVFNGVLVNDSDADADSLTAELVSGPANGALTLNADGSFSYTPDASFAGADSFTYQATDGEFDSQVTTVAIEVSEADIVQIRLEVADTDNVPIDSVTEGESFFVNVYVQDLRPQAQGVFGAYFDLIYPAANVTVTGGIDYAAAFSNGQTGDTTVPGLIDEAGAFTQTQNGSDQVLLLRVPFVASFAGPVTFVADPADSLPASETLVFGVNEGVPLDRIHYVNDDVTVAAAGGGEGEAAAYAAAADQLFTSDDWQLA